MFCGLGQSAGKKKAKLYVDDVFSTYLYTGNGSSQTINNGIDLAGKGGLVWIKDRDNTGDPKNHKLYDTVRGDFGLSTNTSSAQINGSGIQLTSFNSNGFSIGASSDVNQNTYKYASWTFRKAPKFFDVVTWTGNGVAGRTVAHSLGQVPGMIIVKSTSNLFDWAVYHTSISNDSILLNSTAAKNTGNNKNVFGNGTVTVPPTSTQFTLGNSGDTNANGETYVAYLFAHDTGTDGIIQAGSFTTDGSGNATVTLGWEPQWLKAKSASGTFPTGNWVIADSMRGMPVGAASLVLRPNLSDAESAGGINTPTATGFSVSGYQPTTTYIYLAIRRPNKPPTSGTQVYNAISVNASAGAKQTVGFPIDLQICRAQSFSSGTVVIDRLRGVSTTNTEALGPYLTTASTSAELTDTQTSREWDNTGFEISSGTAGVLSIHWNFRRAPGVFDVVCYTGTGSNGQVIPHSLGVQPELFIYKTRSLSGQNWWVAAPGVLTLNQSAQLNSTSAFFTQSVFSSVSAANLTVGTTGANVNQSNATYVAYLFATKPGISKVGSYTGNGSSQTINCGFTTGARFFMCKRTDSTGDWFVWDSARGIVAGNDPHLSLNTTAAEVTGDDSVDPDNSGFIVNQLAATNINVTSATYIFLAMA